MIKGLFFIFLFYFLGEAVSYLINGFVPGSVLGMVFLFLALFFKLLHPDHVRQTAMLITRNMAVFFVPAAVGLMSYYELLAENRVAIITSITASTIFVIVSVALIQEYMEKRREAGK
jgi:holin-like protein